MGNLHKDLAKCKHPNSRKTKALAKKAKRMNNKHKSRMGHAIKSNILGDKLSWFLDNLEDDRTEPLNPDEFDNLIEKYLRRFDEEMAQIKLKQQIGKNRTNQHIARENVLRFTLEREHNEYNGGGMELINLCDPIKFQSLMEWDGNGINIQHLKFDLISKGFLEKLKSSNVNNPKIIVTPSSDEDQNSMN